MLAELVRMHAAGECTIADLMKVFCVGRATVYRVLDRAATSTPGPRRRTRPLRGHARLTGETGPLPLSRPALPWTVKTHRPG